MRLEKFRGIRDEIELKISDWLEHPEGKLGALAERNLGPSVSQYRAGLKALGKADDPTSFLRQFRSS